MKTTMMKQLSLIVCGLLLAGVACPARAQDFQPVPEVSPHQFALMAWGGSPSDPNQLYWMKQAGLNISGFCAPDDLDKVQAAGLTCFVTDPRANHYNWTEMPAEKEIRKNVQALVREVDHHPAALGFFLTDEPKASLMPGLGQVEAAFRQALPGAWSYVNLFPNYASQAQLDAPSYEAYVQKFIDDCHPPLLSYDNYSLFNGKMLDRFYTNLGTVRRLALKAGIPFWNVILSNSHFSYMEPSDATLHLEAYSTMAYGGRGIEYFTYFAPKHGNYRLAPVDQFGHRTATWYKLRRLNNEIHELAPWLARLRSTGVYHSAPVPEGAKPLAQSPLVREVLASSYQNPAVEPEYFIGEFVDPDGHPFLMMVNKDLNHSIRYSIHLRQEGKHLFQISPYTGKEERFQGEMSWLAPGAGALFAIK